MQCPRFIRAMLLWGAVGLLFASGATEAAAQRTGTIRGVVRTANTGLPVQDARDHIHHTGGIAPPE